MNTKEYRELQKTTAKDFFKGAFVVLVGFPLLFATFVFLFT